jgi:hypothetical protein
MTNSELAAIKARADAATPKPWHAVKDQGVFGNIFWHISTGRMFVVGSGPYGENGGAHCLKDAVFIAHARLDVPALIADVVEQLRAMAQAYLAEIEQYGVAR